MKQAVRVAGVILSLVGLGFIANRLVAYREELLLVPIEPSSTILLVLMVIVSAVNLYLLAFAWWKVLLGLGAQIDFVDSLPLYSQTLLAKYVPGNVFQFVARQAVGLADGIPGGILARSALWEIGLIATSGALFSFLLLPLFLGEGGNFISVAALLAATVLSLAATQRFFGIQRATAFLLHSIYMVISGVTFLIVMLLVVPNGVVAENVLVIVGAFVVAWLVGLLTPGAPGGLGVREATLVLLLGELNLGIGVVVAVVISRIVQMLGEVLFVVASIRRKPRLNL